MSAPVHAKYSLSKEVAHTWSQRSFISQHAVHIVVVGHRTISKQIQGMCKSAKLGSEKNDLLPVLKPVLPKKQ